MTSAHPTHTVLLVDDTAQILATVADYLRQHGFRVIEAAGPFGVSGLVSTERPNVMVLDLAMPAMKGDALLSVLRRLPSASAVPAIFYSSAEEEVLYRLTRGMSRTSYVQKSDGLAALHGAIKTCLAARP